MATQSGVEDEEEQDEMEFADWTQGSRSARKPGQGGNWRDELRQWSKRDLEENSSEDDRVVREKVVRER